MVKAIIAQIIDSLKSQWIGGLALLLTFWGIIINKRKNSNEIAPEIIVKETSYKQNKIVIKNIGHGPAVHIKFSSFKLLLLPKNEYCLYFRDIGFLESKDERTLEFYISINGSRQKNVSHLFSMWFSENTTIQLNIGYKNKVGKKYITKVVIKGNSIMPIKTGSRYFWFQSFLDNLKVKFKNWCVTRQALDR